MKQKLLKTWLMLVLMLVGAGTTWAESVEVSSFSAISGNLDSYVSYEAAKGGASTAPAVNAEEIRVYQNGGLFTVSAKNGATITEVVLGSSMATTVTYAVDGGTVSSNQSIAANKTLTVGSINATSNVVFTCKGTDKNSRLYVNYLKVTYTIPTAKACTVTFNAGTNGTCSTSSLKEASAGAGVTLPAVTANPGFSFVGWSTDATPVSANAGSAGDTYKPLADCILYAYYKVARPENEIFYESFDTNDGTGGNDDQWSGSIASSTLKFDNEGWVVENGNGANKCAKFGVGKYLGKAESPALGVSGNATLTFKAAAWDGTSESTTLKLFLSYGNISSSTVTLKKGEWTTYTVYLTGLNEYSKIKFEGNSASNSRFFLDEISVISTGDTPIDLPISDFIKTSTLSLETGAEAYDVRNCLNIPEDYPVGTTGAYNITTTIDGETEKDGEFACAYPYLSFQKAGTYIVTVTAAAVAGKYAETSGTITVTVKEPAKTYASLEELVAADITSGTEVTVSFENVPIKSFQTVSNTRRGVYFDIQKDDKDIEIYFNSAIPAEWVEGGTLSGTMTCPWKLYNGTWELAPASGWAWTNLTYNAPAAKTITVLKVSGTPTKTTYNVGDAFETAGLVVTATYSDGTSAPIANGFDWEIDYGTGNEALVEGATSVDVMVYTDDVMSEVYTVNGLTVTVPVTLTSIAVSGTPTKTEYYAGDAFETAGLVVTGHYSDGSDEVITEGIEWTVDPETLTDGTTSVDVLAGVGSVVSEVYTVNGLTVTKPDFETVTYEFSDFTSGKSVEFIDLEGFVITLNGNGGTNPAWNSNQARVYAKGSLTIKANNATIKSIEYEYIVNANSKGATPTIDGVEGTTTAGTWDEENKTWTGADEEVTFSTSGTAGNIGFTKLIIKYVEGSKITPTLTFSAPTAEVTIGANDNVFPTLTTTPADLEGVTYESSNTDVATIAADGTITLVKAGETTITANFAGNDVYSAATPASYILTVKKAPFVPTPAAEGYEIVDIASLYSSVTTNATVEDCEASSFVMVFAKPESSSTPTKYYNSGAAVRAYTGNTITITAAEPIKSVNMAWAGTVDDAVSITGLGTTTAVVTFSKTCRFTGIVVSYKGYTRSLTNAWGTICLPYDFEGDATTTYYSIKSVQKNESDDPEAMALTKETVLNAGVPYIFCSSNTEAGLTCTATGTNGAVKPATVNGMTGSFTKHAIDKDMYLLSGNKFVKVADGSKVGENRAYIDMSKVPAASAGVKADVIFGFNGDITDGIMAVESNERNAQYVDLSGRRVMNPVKGLYIVNGKKVMIKK